MTDVCQYNIFNPIVPSDKTVEIIVLSIYSLLKSFATFI
jgi:hypothetical protein